MATPSDQICIASLTPTYSTLPRLNTTALLLFILLSPIKSWATKGALAALMARVAPIAIHSIVLLATRDASHPLDLDIIGAWFILSEAAVSLPIMLNWAAALEASKARLLVKIWGVMVFVGAICGFTTMQWARGNADTRSCSISDDLDNRHVSMSKNDIFSPLASGVILGKFDVAAVAAASLGLWTCIRPEAWSQYDSKVASKHITGTFEMLGSVFASVVLVASIVLHERYLLGHPRLPMLLKITAFEQWGCWAATGFIIAATLVNWTLGQSKQPVESVYPLSATRGSWDIEAKPALEWSGILGQPAPSYIR